MIKMKKGTKLTLLFIFTFMLSFLCVLNFNSGIEAYYTTGSIAAEQDPSSGKWHFFYKYNSLTCTDTFLLWCTNYEKVIPTEQEYLELLRGEYAAMKIDKNSNIDDVTISSINYYDSDGDQVTGSFTKSGKVSKSVTGTYLNLNALNSNDVAYIEPVFKLNNTEILANAPMHKITVEMDIERLYYDMLDDKYDPGLYLVHDVVHCVFEMTINEQDKEANEKLTVFHDFANYHNGNTKFIDNGIEYLWFDGIAEGAIIEAPRINMIKYLSDYKNTDTASITDSVKIRIPVDALNDKLSYRVYSNTHESIDYGNKYTVKNNSMKSHTFEKGVNSYSYITIEEKLKIDSYSSWCGSSCNRPILFINGDNIKSTLNEDSYDQIIANLGAFTSPKLSFFVSGSVYKGIVIMNFHNFIVEYSVMNSIQPFNSDMEGYYMIGTEGYNGRDMITAFTFSTALYLDYDDPVVKVKDDNTAKTRIDGVIYGNQFSFIFNDSSYNESWDIEVLKYNEKTKEWDKILDVSFLNFTFTESGKYQLIFDDLFGNEALIDFIIDNSPPTLGKIGFVDQSISSSPSSPIDCDTYDSKINIIISKEKLTSLYDLVKNLKGQQTTEIFEIIEQPYDALSGVKSTKFIVKSVSTSKIVISYRVEDNAGNINEKELILTNSKEIEIVVKNTQNDTPLDTDKTNEYNYQKTVYFEVSSTNNEVGIKNIIVDLVDSDNSFIENILNYENDKTKQFSLSYRSEAYRAKVKVIDNLGVEVSEYYNIKISEGDNIISLSVENNYNKISFQTIVDTTETDISEIKFYYGSKNATIGSNSTSGAHLLENDFEQYNLVTSSKTGYKQYDAVIVDFESYYPFYTKNILTYYDDINSLKHWPYIYVYAKTTGGFEYKQKAYLNFENVEYEIDVGGVTYDEGSEIRLNSSEQLTNKVTINHNISSLSDRLVYPLIYTACYSTNKTCGNNITSQYRYVLTNKTNTLSYMFTIDPSGNVTANTIEIYQITNDYSSTELTFSDNSDPYYATKIATIVKNADSYDFDISVNRDDSEHWSNLNEGRGVFNITITNTNSTSSIEPSGYSVTFYPINKTTGKVSTASISGGSMQCSADSDNSLSCVGYLPSNAETQISARIENGEDLYNDRLFVVVSATNQEGKEYRSTSQAELTSGVLETTSTEKIVYFDTIAPDIKYAISSSNKSDEFTVQLLPFDEQDNLKSLSIYGGKNVSSETLLLNRENINENTDIQNGISFTDEGVYTLVIEDNYGNVKTETITIERDAEGNLSSQEIVGSSNLILTDDEDDDEAGILETIVAAFLIIFFIGLAVGLIVLCIWLYFYLSKFIKMKKAADKAKKAAEKAKKAKERKEKIEQLKKKLLRKQAEENNVENDEEENEDDEEDDSEYEENDE